MTFLLLPSVPACVAAVLCLVSHLLESDPLPLPFQPDFGPASS